MKVRVLGGTNTFKKHKSTNNQWNKHFYKAWRYVPPVEQTLSQSIKVQTTSGTNTFTKHEGTYPRWNKHYHKVWRYVPPMEQTLSQSMKVRTPGGTNTITKYEGTYPRWNKHCHRVILSSLYHIHRTRKFHRIRGYNDTCSDRNLHSNPKDNCKDCYHPIKDSPQK